MAREDFRRQSQRKFGIASVTNPAYAFIVAPAAPSEE
jgi:hypothetical protein